MKAFIALVKRNVKVFFKDKGMFFTSLITPIILLILYSTFLATVYRDSFKNNLPQGVEVAEKLINGTVSGELISSLLAVCCITVAFCSNTLMADDRVKSTINDFAVSPVKKTTIALAYFVSTLITTLIVTYLALIASLCYVAFTGWYMNVSDVFLLILDVFILTTFGSAFSSIINSFLKTQGQVSAFGTVISAGYGFICGAYMPLSQFGEGLRNALMFLPGTYGTSLLRNHAMAGVFREMGNQSFPTEVIDGIKASVDCNIEFFSHPVSIGTMYLVIVVGTVSLIAAYVLISFLKKGRNR